jgi:hypothetical protein
MALCFCAFTNKANAEIINYGRNVCSDGGASGNNYVTATLDTSTGKLTISGTGNMADFDVSSSGVPWVSYRAQITNVEISNGVTNIGNVAFQDCNNLKWITIPEGVTIIGTRAFENCTSLSAIAIPASVTQIEARAFRNCTILAAMYNMATTPQSISNNVFEGVTLSNKYLAVPAQSVETYQSASVWNNFNVTGPYVLIEKDASWSVDIDEAFMGIDGSARYLQYQNNKPKEDVIYDGTGNTPTMAISSNENGLPKRYVSSDGNSFLVNYNGNTCNGTLLTTNGDTYSIDDIPIDDILQKVYDFPRDFAEEVGKEIIRKAIDKVLFEKPLNATTILDVLQGTFEGKLKNAAIKYILPNMPDEIKYLYSCFTYATKIASAVSSCTFASTTTIPLVTVAPETFGLSWIAMVYSWKTCFKSIKSAWEAGQNMTGNLADMLDGWTSNNNTCPVTLKLTGGTLVISGNGALCAEELNKYADRKNEIQRLEIRSGVTSIPSSAFANCSNLTTLTIADSNNELTLNHGYSTSSYPFYGVNFETVHWNRNLATGTYIDGTPFQNKTSLKTVTIGNKVSIINASMFSGCTELSSVTFQGNLITSIPSSTFNDCTSLTSTSFLPSSITEIGNSAFQGCTGLTSLTIPSNITSIGSTAFANCNKLTTLTIADSNNELILKQGYISSSYPFYGVNFETVHWNRNLATGTYIDGTPFQNKISLKTVTIGSKVSTINASMFSGCTELSSVTFQGNLITSIPSSTFNDCTSLTSTSFLPSSITEIGSSAFQGCTGLTSLTIPSNITSIGSTAFVNCNKLTTLTIADSNNELTLKQGYISSSYPFYGVNFETVHWNRNLATGTYIDGTPFQNKTSLKTVTIGNKVSIINANMFSGCTSLTSVTNHATTPQSINANVFSGVPISNIPLYVPASSINLYQAANVWKDFAGIADEITTTSISEKEVVIDWAAVPNAVNYTLSVYRDETQTQLFGTYNIPVSAAQSVSLRSISENRLSYTVTGLLSNTPYYYKLVATGANNNTIVELSGDFVTQSSSGIHEIAAQDISIYPNPVSNELFIKSEKLIDKVEILDIAGRIVVATKSTTVNIAHLPKGIYFAKIFVGNQSITKKIIKE